MVENFEFKENYKIDDLLKIMAVLRGEGGCPWDTVQTHESIKKNFIEETYEVIEAIDNNDTELLKEELGDVLMQVAFHTQIEIEKDSFDFDDVCDGVCKKLVERHPHVFSTVVANDSETVIKNWDEIKKQKKGQTNQTQIMQTIPRQLPALMRATKVQQKAQKVGFDFEEVSQTIAKLEEEIAELKQAINSKNEAEVFEEFGDVLFSAVNVARFTNVDSEEALTSATDKFIKRFSLVETLAQQKGISMQNANLDQLDALWDEAKIILKSEKN